MVPAALSEAIATDRASGKIPVAVVGTCGTTNTGSVDPLDALADICKAENLWFHVDGAYGGSVVLSDRAEVARGIERADSIVWDGHKWLYQIYGCALVLVKDVRTLLAAYSAGGEYLQDVAGLGQAPEWWDMGPELTRPARGPLLWLTLQVAGTKAMREMVSKSIRIAERFEQLVRESSFLEVVTPASLAIVTFSVKADNPEGGCAAKPRLVGVPQGKQHRRYLLDRTRGAQCPAPLHYQPRRICRGLQRADAPGRGRREDPRFLGVQARYIDRLEILLLEMCRTIARTFMAGGKRAGLRHLRRGRNIYPQGCVITVRELSKERRSHG